MTTTQEPKTETVDGPLSTITEIEREAISHMRIYLAYELGPDMFNFYLSLTDDESIVLPKFTTNEEIRGYIQKRETEWEYVAKAMDRLYKSLADGRMALLRAYKGADGLKGRDLKLFEKAGKCSKLILKIMPPMDEFNEAHDNNVEGEANEILRTGEPISYFLDVWGRDYVGMKHYGRSLLFSMMCPTCNNTLGLHPAADGESGTGKTFAMQAMINLNSPEHTISGSCTPKALIYNIVSRGTTVFIDDVGKMDEELARVIKVSCSNYQTGFDHLTVNNGEGERRRFPEAVNWWMTGVEVASFDIQLLNRNVNIALDENKKMKHDHNVKVHDHQREDAKTGRPAFDVTHEVHVCREMSRILLDEEPVNVIIPWIDDPSLKPTDPNYHIVEWTGEDNPRNWPILLDMIRVSASIHRYQRKTADGKLIATLEDYENAHSVFAAISREQVSKLNKRDQEIIEVLKKLGAREHPVDLRTLADALGKDYDAMWERLKGNSTRGTAGFLTRAEGLVSQDERTETEYEKEISSTEMGRELEKTKGSKSKRRVYLKMVSDDDPLTRTRSVVEIDRERATRVLDEYMKSHQTETYICKPRL